MNHTKTATVWSNDFVNRGCEIVTKLSFLSSPDNYASFFNDLKQRIRLAQVKAALAVNQELLLLYWQIGKEIVERQKTEKWGAKIIDRLAKDLKQEFPDMNGFSRSNLKYQPLSVI